MTKKEKKPKHLVFANQEPCRAVLGTVGMLVALEAIKSASPAPTDSPQEVAHRPHRPRRRRRLP